MARTIQSNYFCMTKIYVISKMQETASKMNNTKACLKKEELKNMYYDLADINIKLFSMRKRKY